MCMYHNFFIHSSVDRHLGCFHVLAIVNVLQWTVESMCLFQFWFPQGICLGVGLPGHQFSSVQLRPTLCDPMNHSTPGLSVHHQLPEFTQTHVHRVGNAIQPSHPLSSPSPLAPNSLQYQGLLQWVNCSHKLDKVLEFQLQHQSFQWTPRADLL